MESSAAASLFPWRQLGTLLADEGLLTPVELELALDEQRRTGRLLGQIVVDRGYISAFSLARVLSGPHGTAPARPRPWLHLRLPARACPLGAARHRARHAGPRARAAPRGGAHDLATTRPAA